MHFESGSAVHTALEKIARRLDELQIPYAVVGGMALFSHGYRRFTEDVGILLTDEGLAEVHRRLDGLGYVPVFSGSRNLRDTESGVRIEFLVSGDYPRRRKTQASRVSRAAGGECRAPGDSLFGATEFNRVEARLGHVARPPSRFGRRSGVDPDSQSAGGFHRTAQSVRSRRVSRTLGGVAIAIRDWWRVLVARQFPAYFWRLAVRSCCNVSLSGAQYSRSACR